MQKPIPPIVSSLTSDECTRLINDFYRIQKTREPVVMSARGFSFRSNYEGSISIFYRNNDAYHEFHAIVEHLIPIKEKTSLWV
jgi:hypothetical protein